MVHEIDASQDDFVVLASDGLWDHVSNIEAVEIVRKAAYDDGKPETAGDRLVQVCESFFTAPMHIGKGGGVQGIIARIP